MKYMEMKYMDKIKITHFVLLIIIVSLWSNVVLAQEYPKPVVPGEKLEVAPTEDTLWVLTDAQVRKTIAVAKKYKICEEQNLLYAEKVTKLETQSKEKDELIIILEKDRDYYKKIWGECSTNLEEMGKIAERHRRRARIAIIAGSITTVAAFVTAAILL